VSRLLDRFQPLAVAVVCFAFLGASFAVNPIPTVVGPVVPQAVVPGSGAFTLKVYGANFVSGAVVNWNRSPRTTTFISARALEAQILASDVVKPMAGYITVTNPPPGGGVSSSSFAQVEVHKPTSTIVVGPPHVYFKGNGTSVLRLSDFNNDGILDFAAEFGSEIKVLLGNGDGSFRFGSIATYNYFSNSTIATGDFNNDGNEDLAFGADPNGPPTHIQLNLGNGDGTFRQGSRFWHFPNGNVMRFVVGDFNGDGNLDLISLQNQNPDISVFLGNGDGTFRHKADYHRFAFEMVTADLNGDGKLDLVFMGDVGLFVQLGNGDGTFQKPRQIVSNARVGCAFGLRLVVTDFNGDGIADLAYCERDSTNGRLWIMMGNGDGTFKKPVAIPIQNGIYGFSFAAGDFNSDGKTDLAVSYITSSSSVFELFLGNGDGTFQQKKIVKLPGVFNAEEGIVPADLNSDGLLDFIFQQPGDVSVFTQE
jgi:hypothetical protein